MYRPPPPPSPSPPLPSPPFGAKCFLRGLLLARCVCHTDVMGALRNLVKFSVAAVALGYGISAYNANMFTYLERR